MEVVVMGELAINVLYDRSLLLVCTVFVLKVLGCLNTSRLHQGNTAAAQTAVPTLTYRLVGSI